MARRGPASKRRSVRPPHSLKAVPPPDNQDRLRPAKSRPAEPRALKPPSRKKPAATNSGARWSELFTELKQIRRSLVGNDAVPTHESAFHKILDKILEAAWPADNNGKRKPHEVDADVVDAFQKRVDDVAAVLQPWIGLRSWFLERGELWQTWVDVPPPLKYPGRLADLIAEATAETVNDPKDETDVLAGLIARAQHP